MDVAMQKHCSEIYFPDFCVRHCFTLDQSWDGDGVAVCRHL